ncbi:MAG: hypothetical protein HBSAPP03_10040 [Phycisphaerae bacterium]|nr:MAG: hypothetical protein HBSAPP03_10040 [Phycisphaerae bacterium]
MMRHGSGQFSGVMAGVVGLLALPVAALAQPDPSGIDFVTIRAPGNAAWDGTGVDEPDPRAIGRGSVGYEYRMGRYEVTTSQWVEFFNAAYDRADAPLPHLFPPGFWGAAGTTPNNPGRQRWMVPSGNEMRPVGDISWRMAAMYCNWLHNGKSSDRAAFLSGAYDVSTFGYTGPGGDIFTDQSARSPGATYFIPTWDEWLKAAHYDPNKYGPNMGGWWNYSDSSNTAPVGGLPPSMGGTGEANYGYSAGAFTVPLGAYNVTSPWGLYDVAGATSEWTETIRTLPVGQRFRVADGSYWGSAPGFSLADRVDLAGAEYPSIPVYEFGFRVASVIPGVPTCAPLFALVAWLTVRKRGAIHDASVPRGVSVGGSRRHPQRLGGQ